MIKRYTIGPLATNCWLYKDDITGDSAVIDPGYPDKKLLDDLAHERVKYILITHAHVDHVFGAAALKHLTDAPILAHRLEAERLSDGKANLYESFNFSGFGERTYTMPYISQQIDREVDTGDTIELGKTVFSVLHTPGHTDGSVCYVTEREIFCGDLIFAGSYGRVDFPSGNFADMVDSYNRLCSLDGDYLIYPGHQETTTLRNERNFNPLKSYLYN